MADTPSHNEENSNPLSLCGIRLAITVIVVGILGIVGTLAAVLSTRKTDNNDVSGDTESFECLNEGPLGVGNCTFSHELFCRSGDFINTEGICTYFNSSVVVYKKKNVGTGGYNNALHDFASRDQNWGCYNHSELNGWEVEKCCTTIESNSFCNVRVENLTSLKLHVGKNITHICVCDSVTDCLNSSQTCDIIYQDTLLTTRGLGGQSCYDNNSYAFSNIELFPCH